MRCAALLLTALLGGNFVLAAVPKRSPTPTYSAPPSHNTTCVGHCGGICGDAIVQSPPEECDLGYELNGKPNSGCSINCTIVHFCGDGHVDPGEECDLGTANGTPGSACTKDCHHASTCGNGKVEPPEQCDLGDKNGQPNSGCSCNCTIVPFCGDGHLDPGEQCDLGKHNGEPESGCTKDCKLAPFCGDGHVDPGEECDLGKADNGAYNSGCSTDCQFCPFCGDGIVDEGEECDDGEKNGSPGSNCTKSCTFCAPTSHCGDGHVDPGEQCDLGANNGAPGSTCDATCHIVPVPQVCQSCDPNPFNNKCTITTSCIVTPTNRDFCACRAGYRADGLLATDPKQFRLNFPGQEYRVFVAPGVECNTLCDHPFPGPQSCMEVAVQPNC